jgi:fimbrial isopeptide formation D2 family protein/LPXTG-motif cell wall-anchored protein
LTEAAREKRADLAKNEEEQSMKKLLTGLSAMMMLLPIFGAAASPVHAEVNPEPTESSVTIHKQVWEKGKSPENVQNTGQVMPNFGGTPFKGVGFTIFDISEAFYKFIADHKGDTTIPDLGAAALEKIQKEAADKTLAQLETDYDKVRDEAITTEDGTVTFSNLPHYANGKAIAYMAVETSTPAETTFVKKAAPITFAMPVYKIDIDTNGNITYKDEINTNIHFYAKNEKGTSSKEITTPNLQEAKFYHNEQLVQGFNIESNQVLDYKISFDLPEDIGLQTFFSITDKTLPVPGLMLVSLDTVDIKIAGEQGSIKSLFTIDPPVYSGKDPAELGILTATAKDMKELKEYGGKTIEMTYQMKLDTENIHNIVEVYKNDAVVKVSNDSTFLPGPPVYTAGHKVVKKDALSGNPLAGAEFILSRKNGETTEYGKFIKSTNPSLEGSKRYSFDGWTTVKTDATRLVSDDDGEINIYGLLDNASYELTEVKAPSNDYVILKENVKFDINIFDKETSNLTKLGTTDVENTPKSRLPMTGKNTMYIVLGIGAAIVTGAAALHFVNRKKRNEV